MVVPYHAWMLQRLAVALGECTDAPAGRNAVENLLKTFPRGAELLELDRLLEGCRVRKDGGRLFSAGPEELASGS